MLIKPDNIQFCSLIDTYYNYVTYTDSIAINGSVGAMSLVTFSKKIYFANVNTRADLYLKNLNTGIKQPMDGGDRILPYQFAGSEIARQYAVYVPHPTDPYVEVGVTVTNNTGAPITLTTQTLEITATLYLIPITT